MKTKAVWIALMTLMLLALTTTVVWAAPAVQDGGDTTADVLWTTLAPLLAIATFVERVLEALWDRYESKDAWPNKPGVTDSKAPGYVAKKKLTSHWLGMGIAFLAIGLTNFRFFRLLGLDVLFSSVDINLFSSEIGGILDNFTLGTLIDWVSTAAIIGWGGTELTHSIIEGLVKGRNLWKEMREVQAGEKMLMDAEFFREYVEPRLEERGISVVALRQTFQTLESIGIPADRLIGDMTAGKVDQLLTQLEAEPEKAEAVQAVRNLIEGVPPEQQAEVPNILNLLNREQRERFLGI
jgi:hypothetical protein